MTGATLPDGYTLHHAPPTLADYLHFRSSTDNLTTVNDAQAAAALAGSWHAVHITHSSQPDKAIAMGRVVGDGGWYFIVADIVVLPEHQRKGLADFIMTTLMATIKDRAPKGPPGPHVSLSAAVGARRLYERHWFRDTMPGNMGMGVWLEKAGLQGNN